MNNNTATTTVNNNTTPAPCGPWCSCVVCDERERVRRAWRLEAWLTLVDDLVNVFKLDRERATSIADHVVGGNPDTIADLDGARS